MRLLVVSGLAAGQFALLAAVAQQRRPAAGTGIAEAGAVGVDLDRFHALRHAAGYARVAGGTASRWRSGVRGMDAFRGAQHAGRAQPGAL